MSAKLSPPEIAEPVRIGEPGTPFGYPRDFLQNRFVYLTISPRARGLSVGVDLNPDKACNFDCVYCEVDRSAPPNDSALELPVLAAELDQTLNLVSSGAIRELPRYSRLSKSLLQLRHVALSGNGEPTQCPKFAEAVHAVVHARSRKEHPFFKVVLFTNGTGLDLPNVQDGLSFFTDEDEIWVKLDAGTQAYMDRVNQSKVSLDKVLQNTLMIGRRRSIVIQSLFLMQDGQPPPPTEIESYVARLRELRDAGAHISLVQIYSATRPMARAHYSHLPLAGLSAISRLVRTETGLKTEIY